MSKRIVVNLKDKSFKILDLTAEDEAQTIIDNTNFLNKQSEKAEHINNKANLFTKMGLNSGDIKVFNKILRGD